jgi:hypothetical protein
LCSGKIETTSGLFGIPTPEEAAAFLAVKLQPYGGKTHEFKAPSMEEEFPQYP